MPDPVLLLLALVVGATLGLLGGGGTILMVPVLLFAADFAPKNAIAASLLVVAVTSLAATLVHARAGHVRWKTGALFGAAAMAGAFPGGWLSRHLPGWALLLGFGLMMLATAVAMLRKAKPARTDRPPLKNPLAWIVGEGVAVGGVTGMVGAGGGFLVVPALVVLGRLPMRAAVGTSLLVVSLKSFAGFAGYASYIALDYGLLAFIAVAATVGALVGAWGSRYVQPKTLRSVFGWFVLVMAVFMLGKQLPVAVTDAQWFRALFVVRWPWWAGGLAIGAVVLAFLWFENKAVGVSTGYADLCTVRRRPRGSGSWRFSFLGGIVLGGGLAASLAQRSATFALQGFDQIWQVSWPVKIALLLLSGVLIGFGARTAGGCTSGHSIVGVAQGARSSLLATGAFMFAGFAVTHLVAAWVGGAS